MIHRQYSINEKIHQGTSRHISRLFIGFLLFIMFIVGNATALIWLYETPDSNGNVGQYTSLAFGKDGNPGISYYDVTNHDLKYAEKNGSVWTNSTVDSTGDVGQYSSLAFDSAGNPHIGYFDGTGENLKYAKRNGTTWSIEIVDSIGSVGWYSSLALDNSSNPRISYFDGTNGHLKFAQKNGSIWSNETVDSSGNSGQYSSLALDSAGNPGISYYDSTNSNLKYSENTGISWAITTVDNMGMVGWYTSLKRDNSGMPAISYYDATNQTLKYAKRSGGSWTITTVTTLSDSGTYNSLALNHSGNPFISYYTSGTNDLGFVSGTGTSWINETVDQTGSVGWYSSIALDSSGNPAIGYYDATGGNLKFARGFSPVSPDFSALPVSGNMPLTVVFSDTSTGSPATWEWEFGDGGTAFVQNPTHTYLSAGNYTVNLTSGNPGSTGVISRINYVTVHTPDPVHSSTVVPTQTIQSDSDQQSKVTAYTATGLADETGENIHFDFSQKIDPGDAFGVIQVKIQSRKKAGDIEMIVRKEYPGQESRINDRAVAGYKDISLIGINPSTIDHGTIRFMVSNTWLNNYNLNPHEVTLIRHLHGQWVDLPTDFNYQSGDFVYFTAITSGFSCFAVGGRNISKVSSDMISLSIKNELPQEPGVQQSIYPPNPSVTQKHSVTDQNESCGLEKISVTPITSGVTKNQIYEVGIPYVTAIGIVGFLIAGFIIRRWYIRRQNPKLFQRY